MSPRVTRSASRRAVDSSTASTADQGNLRLAHPSPSSPRKRKVPPDHDTSQESLPGSVRPQAPSDRALKRQRTSGIAVPAQPPSRAPKKAQRPQISMAKPGYVPTIPTVVNVVCALTLHRPSSGDKDNEKSAPSLPEPSKRKPSRSKRSSNG